MVLDYFKKLLFAFRGEMDIKRLCSKGLKVGNNCNFKEGVRIDRTHYWLIEIGNDVTLTQRVIILAHDASMKKHLGYTKIGKVKIGNGVFIGAGTIVLPNVNIGDNSIIGAGSVVTKDIPANVVAAGNPAKVISTLEYFLDKHKSVMTKSPIFDEEYTLRKNVNKKMKQYMNDKTEDYGYIV